MKHIKRFNENNDEDDLKDFCEIHLAYLLDDYNFELGVDDIGFIRGCSDAGQIRLENEEGFKWDDIKDCFIPFLIKLDKIRGHQIKIDGDKDVFIYSMAPGDRSYWYTIPFDDLINDLEINVPKVWTKMHIYLGAYF
jgi:hypothetical protein